MSDGLRRNAWGIPCGPPVRNEPPSLLLVGDDPVVARVIHEAPAGADDGPFIVEWVRHLSGGGEPASLLET